MNPSHRSVVGSVASEGGLCHPSPCHNGGSCESHDGVFTCYCPQGFAGSLCQHDLTKSRYVRPDRVNKLPNCRKIELNQDPFMGNWPIETHSCNVLAKSPQIALIQLNFSNIFDFNEKAISFCAI